LWINRPGDDFQGLFGFIDNNTTINTIIKNLGVNILADGAVSGYQYVGGLVGHAKNSKITNCYVTGKVVGRETNDAGGSISPTCVGGLVGYLYNSEITNCYATGKVYGYNNVGGLVGYAGNSEITNNYATSVVNGSTYVGGLVGLAIDDKISNCYATGAVTGNGTGSSVGGLVGTMWSEMFNCYATGEVTGRHSVGGLVGDASFN
jgi:hypothetical protein